MVGVIRAAVLEATLLSLYREKQPCLAEQTRPHTLLLNSDVLYKSKNIPKLYLNSSYD